MSQKLCEGFSLTPGQLRRIASGIDPTAQNATDLSQAFDIVRKAAKLMGYDVVSAIEHGPSANRIILFSIYDVPDYATPVDAFGRLPRAIHWLYTSGLIEISQMQTVLANCEVKDFGGYELVA